MFIATINRATRQTFPSGDLKIFRAVALSLKNIITFFKLTILTLTLKGK